MAARLSPARQVAGSLAAPRICTMATALVLTLLGGCGAVDPFQQEGTWHPRGVNDGNLAAMVADPSHLVAGRESTTSDGLLAAAAIDRLHRDKVKALVSTDFKVGGGGGGGAGSDSTGALTGAN